MAATAGSIRGSITTKILGVQGVANDGIFVTDGQLDANVTIMSNLRRAISVTGTAPGQVSLTSGKVTKIQNGLQSNGSITLAGELEGQIILNTINGTRTWAGPTTINGSTITPDADFEISQTSATLGGGAIGMAPFRLWKTDTIPPFVDNAEIGPGDGVLETAFVPAGATPVSIRFPGPIQRSTAYATWTNAFIVQCRPLGGEGSEVCDWITVEGGFTFFGPTATTTDTTERRTIRIGRASGTIVRPGIYRVIPKVSETTRLNNAVLCADVDGNPPTVWPPSCGPIPGAFDPPIDPAPSFVFRVIPDCDGNTIDDELPGQSPPCSTNCGMADVNNSGSVTVQDIFDFLGFYFANDLRADVNHTNTVTVQDIFDFLGMYFGCQS